MRIDLEAARALAPDEEHARRAVSWEAPWLPGLRKSSVPRWGTGATWMPPGTKPLVRHRSHDGRRLVVTNDRRPPAGFQIEFDLGVVQTHGQLGTRRLLATEDTCFTVGVDGATAEGYADLGYLETAPLPMLVPVELRRDPASGQAVPVAGPADPLAGHGELLGHLGYVEGFPIEPRSPLDLREHWALTPLVRLTDRGRWRHQYAVDAERAPGDVVLGGLWQRQPGAGMVALHRLADGRVETDAVRAPAIPRMAASAQARWAVAPLNWTDRRPRMWALRAVAGRVRALTTTARPQPGSPPRVALLGHLLREPADGWSPLFTATHLALGDQFVTRSELEAHDLGYRVDGVLGYVADALATAQPGDVAHEIPWGSRFGQRRRYVEGPIAR